MDNNTCDVEGCDRPQHSRGVCQRHYNAAYCAGKLDALRPPVAPDRIHELTNLDEILRRADCSHCGPKTRVRYRVRPGRKPYWECRRRQSTADYNRKTYTWRKYGVTREEIAILADAQQGQCAICGQSSDDLFIDHCHETGRVRGLLCHRCNSGIGMFGDDYDSLVRAVRYLKRWR